VSPAATLPASVQPPQQQQQQQQQDRRMSVVPGTKKGDRRKSTVRETSAPAVLVTTDEPETQALQPLSPAEEVAGSAAAGTRPRSTSVSRFFFGCSAKGANAEGADKVQGARWPFERTHHRWAIVRRGGQRRRRRLCGIR